MELITPDSLLLLIDESLKNRITLVALLLRVEGTPEEAYRERRLKKLEDTHIMYSPYFKRAKNMVLQHSDFINRYMSLYELDGEPYNHDYYKDNHCQ